MHSPQQNNLIALTNEISLQKTTIIIRIIHKIKTTQIQAGLIVKIRNLIEFVIEKADGYYG